MRHKAVGSSCRQRAVPTAVALAQELSNTQARVSAIRDYTRVGASHPASIGDGQFSHVRDMAPSLVRRQQRHRIGWGKEK